MWFIRSDQFARTFQAFFALGLFVIGQPPAMGQYPSFPQADIAGIDDGRFVPVSPIIPGTLDRWHGPLLRQDLKINGAQSCATASCHAGPRPGIAQPWASRGSEYSLWLENDPHANSWRTICGDESVDMMKRLKIMVGDQIVDQAGFDNCLSCHNSTRRYNEPRTSGHANTHEVAGAVCRDQPIASMPDDVHRFQREGVGCSACHGPSEIWIQTHFANDWASQDATGQGFVEAGDLYVRARMCASCHIGDQDRDMNHDIIAAGHPALRYEFATFHAWQPKHWRDDEAADSTRYEAQLWLAGQVAATDASLSLLQTRAMDGHTASQWPELASLDCASCHHDLGLDNQRGPITDTRKAVGRYSQWNDAGLRWLINYRMETGAGTQQDFELLAALDQVRDQMESGPAPDASHVAGEAAAARQALARWVDGTAGIQERQIFRSDRLGRVVASAAGKTNTFQTWESAVQFYLAAVAARESWPGGWNGPIKNSADRMRNGLRYPEMIDVSRYAKRSAGVKPTLSVNDTMRLGIEIAGWLGPVSLDAGHPLTSAVGDRTNDETISESMRIELQSILRRIEARWTASEAERKRQFEQTNPNAEAMPTETKAKETVRPKRIIKSDEQLLEEQRKRQQARP
ncbi:hypothetical protein K227x_25800 [Rubripirellula lacrimiformis]|uniref:Uncharacterized protein n=1 Tax=Rubripirellula lacrimiformis TaxID=1930273 RepID=A0A517NAN2_9BACT|nr:hypothetical protein [Rubripirellula lacrimiformis]QDT04191.1 hypothetical protein K227x_25800 [Rubripirellula lacrimiformis]